MKDWFSSLSRRERFLVAGAAVVLVMIAGYLLAVEPVLERRAALERGVAAQQELLGWMRAQTGGDAPTARAESLFASVDRSARQTALAGSIQRIQPEGQTIVRVWLDAAPFDELVSWVARLDHEHGITVSALAVDRGTEPGKVGARLTLERR